MGSPPLPVTRHSRANVSERTILSILVAGSLGLCDLYRNPRNPYSPVKGSTMGKMFLFFLFAAAFVLAAAEIARMLP